MSRATIPGSIGSKGKVRLFEPPVRFEGDPEHVRPDGEPNPIAAETDEQFEARLKEYELWKSVELVYRYLDPDAVEMLHRRGKKVAYEERARLVELRKANDRDDFPHFHSSAYRTEEGKAAIGEHVLNGLELMLVGINGLDVGDPPKRSEEMEQKELIRALEFARWSHAAYVKLLTAQDPTKRHLFC